MSRTARISFAATLCLVATMAAAGPAPAAPVTVSCLNPGDLQAAVEAATPGSVVEVGPGRCIEHLSLAKDLTLRGAGAGTTIVDGAFQGLSTIRIDGPATIVIEDLTVTGGGGPVGGGIRVWGPAANVTMRRIEVTGNLVSYGGGGVEVRQATARIEDSSIHDNHVAYPGGEAPVGGGGIYTWSGTTLTVTGSAVYANSAGGIDTSGGGIYNGATLTVRNSTISGNRAVRGGGGIYSFAAASIVHSTIAANRVEQRPGSLFPANGGGIMKEGGTLTLEATIVALNSAAAGRDCLVAGLNPTPLESDGYNLIGNVDGCSFTASTGDLVGNLPERSSAIDPQLGPLQDNGGPTLTHALVPGSPAVDAIPPANCAATTDQRGELRPQGAGCDIGAYERGRPASTGLVDQSSGRWYLRRADGSIASFYFGLPGDLPLFGDWDGDGIDTPAMYRQSTGFVYLRDTNATGVADRQFYFGAPGDVPLAGDWDGNGVDTFGVYRNGQILLRNSPGTGLAEVTFSFGAPGDMPLAGDFNGDGRDEIGLYRPTTGLMYGRLEQTTGPTDFQFFYGDPGDRFLAADWTGEGADTPAVYRPTTATFYLRTSNTPGTADTAMTWGEGSWLPVAGNVG